MTRDSDHSDLMETGHSEVEIDTAHSDGDWRNCRCEEKRLGTVIVVEAVDIVEREDVVGTAVAAVEDIVYTAAVVVVDTVPPVVVDFVAVIHYYRNKLGSAGGWLV